MTGKNTHSDKIITTNILHFKDLENNVGIQKICTINEKNVIIRIRVYLESVTFKCENRTKIIDKMLILSVLKAIQWTNVNATDLALAIPFIALI